MEIFTEKGRQYLAIMKIEKDKGKEEWTKCTKLTL